MIKLAAKLFANLRRDEKGASSIEYAILAAVLIGIVVTAVGSLGTSLNTAYTAIGTKITTQANK